jgi:membrane associated rhomboid family serine protease
MAFLQSQPPREPFLHAPAVVLWLIAVLALAHVIRVLLPPGVSDEILTQFALVPARYGHPGASIALAVPLVSHMLLHANFVHLGVNCLWLLAFGPIVARRLGSALFIVFFIGCGIAGALTYVGLNWGSHEGAIGASGAISGLMAAAIRMLPWARALSVRGLAPVLSRPVLIFTGIWFATNLLFGMTGFGVNGQIEQIAWQAHVGGYVAGLLLIGSFDSLRRNQLAKRMGMSQDKP